MFAPKEEWGEGCLLVAAMGMLRSVFYYRIDPPSLVHTLWPLPLRLVAKLSIPPAC